jgi:hypothetical protein
VTDPCFYVSAGKRRYRQKRNHSPRLCGPFLPDSTHLPALTILFEYLKRPSERNQDFDPIFSDPFGSASIEKGLSIHRSESGKDFRLLLLNPHPFTTDAAQKKHGKGQRKPRQTLPTFASSLSGFTTQAPQQPHLEAFLALNMKTTTAHTIFECF